MASHKYEIREICGDWALDIHFGNRIIALYFNSRNNAELVKSILEWEDAHPNEAVPYKTTITPPNEWVSVEERLPEESDGMVLLTNGKIVISGYRNQLFGLDGKQGVFAPSIKRGGGYMQVTYWMHLPEPPGKGKNR